jgi:hypothetical protein
MYLPFFDQAGQAMIGQLAKPLSGFNGVMGL